MNKEITITENEFIKVVSDSLEKIAKSEKLIANDLETIEKIGFFNGVLLEDIRIELFGERLTS